MFHSVWFDQLNQGFYRTSNVHIKIVQIESYKRFRTNTTNSKTISFDANSILNSVERVLAMNEIKIQIFINCNSKKVIFCLYEFPWCLYEFRRKSYKHHGNSYKRKMTDILIHSTNISSILQLKCMLQCSQKLISIQLEPTFHFLQACKTSFSLNFEPWMDVNVKNIDANIAQKVFIG